MRGKFAKPGTTLKLPAYLAPDVEAYLSARASAHSVAVDQFVNRVSE